MGTTGRCRYAATSARPLFGERPLPCARISSHSLVMAWEGAFPPSCRSRSTLRQPGTARRKPLVRRAHGSLPGTDPGPAPRSTDLLQTTPRSSCTEHCPSSLESLHGSCDLGNLVRLGVIPKRARYCDPTAKVRMREVAMASTPAAIYEAGTLELRDEIANLGWHASRTRPRLFRMTRGQAPSRYFDRSSTPSR